MSTSVVVPSRVTTDSKEVKVEDKSMRASSMVMRERPHTGLYAIGITMLIFILAQTGAIAYWAGQQNRALQSNEDSVREVKQQIDYLRTQNEILSKQMSELKGRQDAEDRRRDAWGKR